MGPLACRCGRTCHRLIPAEIGRGFTVAGRQTCDRVLFANRDFGQVAYIVILLV